MPHDHACDDPACGCGGAHETGPRPPVATHPRPWRPEPRIRAIALGILRNNDRILAGPIHDDAGQIIGWRPLGGGVRFGERAADTLVREMTEETALEVDLVRTLGTLENIFDHHGTPGHEVVFVFELRFRADAPYEADQIAFSERPGEEMTAKWVSLDKARAGRLRLLPDGLLELL